jgi:hypothetical protein
MKKAQSGVKVTKKVTKKYVPTSKEKQNLKDATQMKNMRPTGPSENRVKTTLGGAKNGGKMSKCKSGCN